jgi:uncharacterized protein YbaR (Trm112 family)
MSQDENPASRKLLTPNDLIHLVCPACHAALQLEGAGAILCGGCNRRYPIVDGLPILLIESAL